MKSRYKFVNADGIYFLTCAINGWLLLFRSRKYCDIIINSLLFCRKKFTMKLHAYVIMPDHIHLVISGPKISNIIKSFKMFTAKEIISKLKADSNHNYLNKLNENKLNFKRKSTYQVWQEDSHPVLADAEIVCLNKIEYIHNNPVKKGLVQEPEMWKYSSARNYVLKDESVIEIDDPFQ
jgi:putative transposase